MPDIQLKPVSVLGGFDRKFGANRVSEITNLALVSVAVPQSKEHELENVLQEVWQLSFPSPVMSEFSSEIRAIQSTPDQLMFLFSHDIPNAAEHISAKLGTNGYTTDQTDAWVMIEVSGPDVLAALERLCPIDLDQSVFAVGAYARTVMEHMGGTIVRLDSDRFLLMSASSSAGSFLHAVTQSFDWVTEAPQ